MSRTHTLTFDNRDTNSLQYQDNWFIQGTYNATRTGETGTLSSSNRPMASVTFMFPQPAVEFRYYGIKRSQGGRYGICVDCDPNNRVFQTIDGVNPTDDGQNPPEVLFSIHFKAPSIHEIILQNQADDRFEGGNSQITIDRFELDVPDSESPVTNPPSLTTQTSTLSLVATVTSPEASTAPETLVMTGSATVSLSIIATQVSANSTTSTRSSTLKATNTTSSSSSSSSSSEAPASGSSSPSISILTTPTDSLARSPTSSGVPVGVIVGAAIGGCVGVLLLLLCLWLFCWRKPRQIRLRQQVTDPFPSTATGYLQHPPSSKGTNSSESFTTRSATVTTSFTKSSIPFPTTDSTQTSGPRRTSGPRQTSEQRQASEPRADPHINSRREVDAGPVISSEAEGETLPPEYDQVFR